MGPPSFNHYDRIFNNWNSLPWQMFIEALRRFCHAGPDITGLCFYSRAQSRTRRDG